MTSSTPLIALLNERFSLGDRLRFEQHRSGLTQGVIESDRCSGRFFLLGGHVAAYHRKGSPNPILFMSDQAVYEVGKPIRGGIPICFPWFGTHKQDPKAPAHGLVRTELWNVVASREDEDGVHIELSYAIAPWEVRYSIRFGDTLGLEFHATNRSSEPRDFELALHTYFSLSSVEQVEVRGLEESPFLDQLTKKVHSATHAPIRFVEETDRIYEGEQKEIQIVDAGWKRTIEILPQNSKSTVVWNPWIEKAKRLSDFGDDEYPRMCCIETAQVGQNAVRVDPNEGYSVAVTICEGKTA